MTQFDKLFTVTINCTKSVSTYKQVLYPAHENISLDNYLSSNNVKPLLGT